MQEARIGILGYGEVGRTFAVGLPSKPGVAALAAWDCTLAAPSTAGELQAVAAKAAVALAASLATRCQAATLVISAVTASSTLAVAKEAARYDWMAVLAREGVFDGIAPNWPWQEYADRLVNRFRKE